MTKDTDVLLTWQLEDVSSKNLDQPFPREFLSVQPFPREFLIVQPRSALFRFPATATVQLRDILNQLEGRLDLFFIVFSGSWPHSLTMPVSVPTFYFVYDAI